ncbi:MAG: hypothetical protein WC895_01520 [Candidatus Shapirobacteria bacterium]|jgi:hypothetical protein
MNIRKILRKFFVYWLLPIIWVVFLIDTVYDCIKGDYQIFFLELIFLIGFLIAIISLSKEEKGKEG